MSEIIDPPTLQPSGSTSSLHSQTSQQSHNDLPPSHTISMFALLGVLNALRMRISCITLDLIFAKININEHTWQLLQRSLLPKNEYTPGMEQLLDTVTEFVKRYTKQTTI